MNVRRLNQWQIWILVPLVAMLGSCSDMGVEPWPPDPAGNIVTILSSGFEITAAWQPASGTVGLSVHGTIRLVAHKSPIEVVSYTLQYGYQATEVNLASKTLAQYQPQLLDIRDDIRNFVPLVLKPLKEVRVTFHSRISGKDSLFTMSVPVTTQCAVLGGCEPGLTKLYEGSDLTLCNIVWAHDGQSFYFSLRRDYNEEVCQYRFADRLIHELTPRTRSLAVRDESPDGKFLLVSDNNALPSGIYLLNLQTLAMQLLIPPQGDAIVLSARFSPDGKKIAFTNDRPVSGCYQSTLWLFSRSDSVISMVLRGLLGYSLVITDWNMNGELVYHNWGGDLNLLSSGAQVPRRIWFPYGFAPRQLLSDNATVAGIIIGDVEKGSVVENHLVLMDLSGKPVRQLTFAHEVIFDYAVAPDRSKVVFTTHRDEQQSLQLYLVSIPGSQAGK